MGRTKRKTLHSFAPRGELTYGPPTRGAKAPRYDRAPYGRKDGSTSLPRDWLFNRNLTPIEPALRIPNKRPKHSRSNRNGICGIRSHESFADVAARRS